MEEQKVEDIGRWRMGPVFLTWIVTFFFAIGHLPVQDVYIEFAANGIALTLILFVLYVILTIFRPSRTGWIYFCVFNVVFWPLYDELVNCCLYGIFR